MHIEHTICTFFSPTGNTRTLVESVAAGLALKSRAIYDQTLPRQLSQPAFPDHSVALLGAPVYAGRIPELALTRLRPATPLKGIPAILLVSYGNRAFEDALREFFDAARSWGFIPVAAGAFIGEHSYSLPEAPLATDRPDSVDLDLAQAFGHQIREMLRSAPTLQNVALPEIPGNFPYRESFRPGEIAPESRTDLCTLCGQCATVCPDQAIVVTAQGVYTDPQHCLRCCACLRVCPTMARVFTAEPIANIRVFLQKNFSHPQEPQCFLPPL